MLVVAITRWERPFDQEAAALAPLLGLGVYDAKLRLGGPTPVVFARVEDADRARSLLEALRQRGHGAVACDLARVPSSETLLSPRNYELGAGSFVTLDPAHGRQELPYAEILALIRASQLTSQQLSTVTTEKKLALGRAALSGGLVRHKVTTTSSTSHSEEREQVLYVVRKSGRDALLLCERQLRHEGLGAQRQATSLANFTTLVETLRGLAPDALYDERLLERRRKSAAVSMSGGAKDRLVSRSNASENDLAAHLLAVAHLTGQL